MLFHPYDFTSVKSCPQALVGTGPSIVEEVAMTTMVAPPGGRMCMVSVLPSSEWPIINSSDALMTSGRPVLEPGASEGQRT